MFTSGDVGQLDAVAAGPLTRLAAGTPVLPVADRECSLPVVRGQLGVARSPPLA